MFPSFFCFACLLPAIVCLLSAVLLQARDGVTLPSYLTLPPLPGAPKALLPPNPKTPSPEFQAWGSVARLKLPLVLFVHGGPWGRDVWGLESTAQWFANRGYAVLQVCVLEYSTCRAR
jgi:dipeptidyl aminopeptidase/acylaminoacyl peptidase